MRRQERDWPTLPIPFSVLKGIIYEQLARKDWLDRAALPPYACDDEGLLKSAVAAPFQTLDGREAYPTVPAKAACLFRGLVKNHGLVDGNKRLAVTTMSVFLLANGWHPTYSNKQLYLYALRVAGPGPYPVATIERWIRRNAQIASDEELARVRAILQRFREEAGGDQVASAFSED